MTATPSDRTDLVAPGPIEVRHLFQPDRDALIDLLSELSPSEWTRPTVCAGWDVRDVALHVLGGDLSNIARRRDGFTYFEPAEDEPLGRFLERMNEDWVEAARRFSPRLMVELLGIAGQLMFTYFKGLDPSLMGGRVSWAGPGPAPVWLDLAREYMERWVHQQHIRDAIGRPGQHDARFSAPVVAASMHALPIALAAHARPAGSAVSIRIEGDAGGEWSVVREAGLWRLFEGSAAGSRTTVAVATDDWWRLVTLGLSADDVRRQARVEGDPVLAKAILSAVAIIA